MPETPAPTERRAVLPIPFRMPEADLRAGNRPSVVPLIDAPSSLGEPGLGESGLMLASGLGAEIPIYRGALLANPPAAPNTTIAPIAPAVPAAPISVPSDVQAAKLIRKVIPVYPQMARVTRTQGTVRITGTIGKDGAIARLQLVSGHPLLVQAALEAVKQWTYQPTLLNGQPVEVITTIDVMFRLN
jgi:protein TonB